MKSLKKITSWLKLALRLKVIFKLNLMADRINEKLFYYFLMLVYSQLL